VSRADALLRQIDDIRDYAVANRRHLHQHPEIGFETRETENFIKRVLENEGIEILPSPIGVIARIAADREGAGYVALRADIDALQLEEKNDVPYRSRVDGRMHACGHDGHSAMLLCAARILKKNEDALKRAVLLVFQPAEEGPFPGGAAVMLEDLEARGLLRRITAACALHLSTDYDVGTCNFVYGPAMASTDDINIMIKGRGGHVGRPHMAIDPVSIGAKFITGMESFMSRFVDPFNPAVFAIAMFNAGTARNVIPDTATLTGTLRSLSEESREKILNGARDLLSGLCSYTHAEFEADFKRGIPVLVNDDGYTRQAQGMAERIVGARNVRVLKSGSMAAEDFACFLKEVPGTFVWIGAGNKDRGLVSPIHNPTFDFDEDALAVGAKLLCLFALEAG
jgi:amidohydrolase